MDRRPAGKPGPASGRGTPARRAILLGLAALPLAAAPGAAQTVPPPSAGLGSNHNYYLYNDGKPILGLVVTVEITKDVVCDDIGFHLQLNANSPEDAQTNWQQYVMGFNPSFADHGRPPGPVVGATIEYFAKPNSFNTPPSVAPLKGLPGPRTLPAGAKFTITMQYAGDAVSGAIFTYGEKGGRNAHTWTIAVPPAGVPTSVRTPIVAFQLDIVGRNAGDNAVIRSGAGKITYSSSGPMTVAAKKPKSKGQTTAETANSVYGELPPGPSTSFTQDLSFTNG